MSPEDLQACYAANHRRLYLAALAVTLDRESAEDAVHDALENVLRTRRQPANLLGYVMCAVRNAAIDIVRRRRRHDALAEAVFLVEEDVRYEVSPRALTAVFGELRVDERQVIWLHLYADMSFQETSEMRQRSINTVTSWYRRGIERLQELLEVHGESG